MMSVRPSVSDKQCACQFTVRRSEFFFFFLQGGVGVGGWGVGVGYSLCWETVLLQQYSKGKTLWRACAYI